MSGDKEDTELEIISDDDTDGDPDDDTQSPDPEAGSGEDPETELETTEPAEAPEYLTKKEWTEWLEENRKRRKPKTAVSKEVEARLTDLQEKVEALTKPKVTRQQKRRTHRQERQEQKRVNREKLKRLVSKK